MSHTEPILAEFLTLEALAAELQRNKRTLDRWDALGIGPPRTRVGRRVLYRRASVQKWLLEQESDGRGCDNNSHDKSNARKGDRA
ncbi:helix-turn-helix domain-containing protein [Bradyrhizobium sp. Tv2a-2]|uniref:helix-turn-helix transcriptional regulator n=1 Tax=Bradyrhizobium sp. Tv2a-2 TaxID=113395 RepID=UPI0004676AB9|nr:helix-turn-helix domain-containing protein [Bradyrhizobium sp. Tv2a-2]